MEVEGYREGVSGLFVGVGEYGFVGISCRRSDHVGGNGSHGLRLGERHWSGSN